MYYRDPERKKERKKVISVKIDSPTTNTTSHYQKVDSAINPYVANQSVIVPFLGGLQT